jgi:transposase
MLEALIEGEQEPAAIAELVHPRMRPKIPALIEALIGRFGEHHRFMTRLFLDRIDAHNADIARLDARIEAAMEPFRGVRELLMSIPGISRIVAEVFIAETGADMSVFPTAQHLASWCGVCPGSNESAGKVKSTSLPRRPVSQGRVGDCRAVGRQAEEDLLVDQTPADHRPAWTDASIGVRRARHDHRRVAHAHQR